MYRYSDGSYLECQDFWRLSGIYRDVVLWSPGAPAASRDFGVVTDLDEQYRDAQLEVEATLRNARRRGARPTSLEATLLDAGGRRQRSP